MKSMFTASAIALAFASVSVQAQEAAAPPASTDDTTGIADIVVTAQRRSESLQKVAIAVSAVSSEELAAKGIVNVTELTKIVPAVKIGQVAAAGIQITVRGVGNFGGNTYGEPGVAVNLDGVYLARSPGASGIFFDIDRVEILKGPQGTLYGRNSTGGVVNVITKKPTSELGAEFTAEIGNYELRRFAGALNLPLGEGFALRLSGQAIERDGFLSDGYNDESTYAARAQLKIDPAAGLSILLAGDYSHTGGKGSNGVFVPYLDPNNPYLGPSSGASNGVIDAGLGGAGAFLLPDITDRGFQNITNWGVSGTVDYDFGFAAATIIAAHRETGGRYLHYAAGFPVSDDTTREPSKYSTVEARLASSGDGPFKWVIGAFYFDDLLNVNIYPEQGVTFAQSNVGVTTKSWSGFAQGTYALTDAIRLTLGGRYTSDKKEITGYVDQAGACPGPIPNTTTVTIFRPYTNSNVLACRSLVGAGGSSDKTFDKFTWKAGLEADIGPDSLLYASVSTGFKAGGFFGAGEPNSYQPESLTAYTIGSKNRFFDNMVQLNVEAYYWDYTNKQITHLGPVQPFGYNLIVENAGAATIYGVEIEALFKPSDNDLFTIQYQYGHSKYDSFEYNLVGRGPAPASTCPFVVTAGPGSGNPQLPGGFNGFRLNCSGRPLPYSPESVINLAYQHTFELGNGSMVVVGLSTHIETSFWVGEEYLPGQKQGGSMVSDADLTWRSADRNYSITGYIQNIEDEAVYQSGFVQPTLGRPLNVLRPPRTYGVRVGAKF